MLRTTTSRRLTIATAITVAAGFALAPGAHASDALPAPSVSSSYFPSVGSGGTAPLMRTPGTVTFTVGAGTTGDPVRFQYDLNSELSTVDGSTPSPTMAGSGSGWVPIAADGTATVTLDPTKWNNWIDVRTENADGQTSQSTRYTFFTTSNGPDARSDLNGDQLPDLVATGKDGNLYILYGSGGGALQAATSYADSGTDWASTLIAQNGDLAAGDGFQDILRINAAGSAGTEVNNGLGDFNRSSTGWYRSDGNTWAGATQIALLGPDTVSAGSGGGTLLSVENGQLLDWPGTRFGIQGTSTVIDAGFGTDATLVAPGDMNGDGHGDFLVRQANNGKLFLAPSNADGSFGGPSTWKEIGKHFKASDYPLLTSLGDVNGDGLPDLYAVTCAGTLVLFPGTATGGFGPAQPIATSGIDWSQITAIA
ncbi:MULTISPECIES: VCBS repeat-containing protein [Streptacidiphilus]|uniref:FG-GAP repeat domain-containing protein n=1 Tax=Streptacidiphilus cavernicola TaxID=3342716 RepID=A0ABV6V0Z6_9ACTN|nr:VCBS repeat-containing protein [Streptacidiphilus jeojiense]